MEIKLEGLNGENRALQDENTQLRNYLDQIDMSKIDEIQK